MPAATCPDKSRIMPQWHVSNGLVDYNQALEAMTARNTAIAKGMAEERIWLLEHPPLYTAGTSANPDELLCREFPVFETGRGGRYTYHGPGQRVAYLMLDLTQRGRDVRGFVSALEQWVIDALADCGVAARTAPGRIGIWTDDQEGQEAKIGAIGIRIRKWVTMHGLAVNIDPDLAHFSGIVPCGISEYPVTSLAALGQKTSMQEFDGALKAHLPQFLDRIGKAE